MTRTLISIIIIAMTFAGIPAQAFVVVEDHSCCDPANFIGSQVAKQVEMNIMAAHDIGDTKSAFITEHMNQESFSDTVKGHDSVNLDTPETNSDNQFSFSDLGCSGCDSPLSCFGADSPASVSNFLIKTYTTYSVYEPYKPSSTQFINIESPPEIRPPIS